MNLSSIELWQRIAAEGLASPMQCRTWAAEAAKLMQAADTTDGLKVLQKLIEIGRLTNYQAKILAGQSQEPLQRGSWHILRRVKEKGWVGWLEVTQIDTTRAEWPPSRWSKWLRQEDLSALTASAPALPRGLQLASVEADHLQSVHMPELNEGELQIQVEPLQGKILTSAFTSPVAEPIATQIIREVAGALSHLHQQDIVHGRVLPDRVYWDGERSMLARDPICVLTATLDPKAVGLLGENLGAAQTVQFLAPEFIAPGQVPTIRSDVYSLGSLWWWMLTGKPIAAGASPQQILAAHAERPPSLPDSVAIADPLLRVLQHALARNISSRFESATEFCAAFDQANKVIEAGKQIPDRKAHAQKAPASVAAEPVTEPVTEPGTKQQPSAKAQNPKTTSVQAQSPSSTGADDSKQVADKRVDVTPNAGKPASQHPVSTQSAGQERAPKRKEPEGPETKKKPAARQASNASAQSASAQSASVQSASVQSASAQSASAPAESCSEAQETTKAAAAPALAAKGRTSQSSGASSLGGKTGTGGAVLTTRRRQRRKKSNKWLLPVLGGGGFLIVLLLALKFSGALELKEQRNTTANLPRPNIPTGPGPTLTQQDPLLEHYRLLESGDTGLWAPPFVPKPLELAGLPPGAQMFVSLRPKNLLASAPSKELLSAFGSQLSSLLQLIADRSGLGLEAIDQVTVAYYSPLAEGGMPQTAMWVKLAASDTLGGLRNRWQQPSEEKVGEQSLLVSGARAFYIDQQPLVDVQSVDYFSVGPQALMREVAELSGAAGPLLSQMEKVWQRSSSEVDLAMLVSPPYLFTEGRGVLANAPDRLRDSLKDLVGNDMRAGLLQMQFSPQWYYELHLIGASDRDAGPIAAKLEDRLTDLPGTVEQWFVEQSPHPYWRSIAFRYPQMLRQLLSHSRFGVERGIAVTNAYLPEKASVNILLSSWIALQDGATLAGELTTNSSAVSPAQPPLTLDQYLARPIRVSFDQEPIEVALQLIADEANDDLPPGTPRLKFLLDGDAFELSGITRNQQLSDFVHNDQPVRDALTEVAKRGNPVPTVTDLREEDQKLIWVVADDPSAPGSKMISLTTRAAATSAGIAMPVEFAPAP